MRHRYEQVLVIAVWMLCAGIAPAKGQHRPNGASGKRPIPSHKVTVYETFKDNEHQEDYSKEYLDEIRHEPQYRLLLKRKRQMAAWKIKYAWVPTKKGVIIDERTFSTPSGDRTIVAWMTHMFYSVRSNEYTCPDVTNGCGDFSGKLYFSLLDTNKRRVINTINIYLEDVSANDDTIFRYIITRMAYPFSIANPKKQDRMGGLIYHAIGGTDSTDGEADILHLRDINGDGDKYEFGLYFQRFCMGKLSTLIGYNAAKDSLYWYTWDMTNLYTKDGKDYIERERTHWVDNAVAFQFNKRGKLRFDIDYRGRLGPLVRYTFTYNKVKDSYSGIGDGRDRAEDSTSRGGYYEEPLLK